MVTLLALATFGIFGAIIADLAARIIALEALLLTASAGNDLVKQLVQESQTMVLGITNLIQSLLTALLNPFG